MSNYELKYLNLRGRGEPIRLMLHHLQVPFKDTRIDRVKEWPSVKNEMPFKQVPVLIVDGNTEIAQSAVILRYLAKKHGLEAKTVEEQAVCDMYAEYIQDFIMNIRPWIWAITKGSSEEEKQEKFNNLFVPQVTENFGPIFQKQLEKSGTGYLVGELTWADFMLAEWSDKIVTVGKSDILDNFPKILEHRNKILSLSNIQEYLKNRPDSKF